MANNLLWVASKPKSPERDEEYNIWYNDFHLQQMLKLPGVLTATRYKLSHLQMEWFPPSAVTPVWPYGNELTYVALYELDAGCDPRGLWARMQARDPAGTLSEPEDEPVAFDTPWFYEAFTDREASAWPHVEGTEPKRADGAPNHIFVVPISPIEPELDDEFNKWYIAQVNIRRPGIAAGVRYRLSAQQPGLGASADTSEWPFGQHAYLMICELYDALTAYNDLRAGVMVPRPAAGTARPTWQASWVALRKVDEHIVYEPISHRVTPRWLK